MKLRATKKEIKDNFHADYIIKIGYCDMQFLLRYQREFAYSRRAEGWACDYYEIFYNNEKYCISTGYAPIGKDVDYVLLRDLEKQAQKIACSDTPYETREQETNALLYQLLESMKK